MGQRRRTADFAQRYDRCFHGSDEDEVSEIAAVTKDLARFTQLAIQETALRARRQPAFVMTQSYTWIVGLEKFQRNCRLTLKINGGLIPLAFDDAIDFKIEIAKVLDGAFPTELHGRIEPWKTTFLPNQGGLMLEIRNSARPSQFLTLDPTQTMMFSDGLQDFHR